MYQEQECPFNFPLIKQLVSRLWYTYDIRYSMGKSLYSVEAWQWSSRIDWIRTAWFWRIWLWQRTWKKLLDLLQYLCCSSVQCRFFSYEPKLLIEFIRAPAVHSSDMFNPGSGWSESSSAWCHGHHFAPVIPILPMLIAARASGIRSIVVYIWILDTFRIGYSLSHAHTHTHVTQSLL